MRRITYWVLSTLSVVVLLFGFDASSHATSPSATPPAAIGSTTGSGSSSGSGTTGSTGASSTGSGGSSNSGSGSSSATKTVTGDVADTQWGPVQVQLTMKGGTIKAVSVLQYPSGNSNDAQINNYALPILIQETTQKQSAGIDMVSGATVTSDGYIRSLQSAIDKA